MPFKKGHKLSPGRAKGSQNAFNRDIEAIALKLGTNPIETLLRISMGDWKGLGYKNKTEVKMITQKGDRLRGDVITLEERNKASAKVAPFFFATKKSVELSDPEGKNPFESLAKIFAEAVAKRESKDKK